MKNTRIIKIAILTITLSLSYALDLNASDRLIALNDTTEILNAPIKKIDGYSLMESFLDDFEFNDNLQLTEKPSFIANVQLLTATTKHENVPSVDLNKFHKDDFFNHIEDSVQHQLVKHQLTQTVYRDYFRIPLKLAK